MHDSLKRLNTARLGIFLALVIAGGCGVRVDRPSISEDVSPVEIIAPIAEDGHVSHGYLRKPPGNGPFPAVVLVHGGLREMPPGILRDFALGAYPSRFLEAGYVTAVITYRSRDDPLHESAASLADVTAAVEHVRALPFVDRRSVVVNGCSGGGDLALRLAGTVDLPAVVAEEPAPLMTHLTTRELVEQYFFSGEDVDLVALYRSAGGSATFREWLARIASPVLIVQGHEDSATNRFNAEILIPALRAAGKDLRVADYSGAHCFAFAGGSTEAVDAFQLVDAYFKEHLVIQPTPIDASLVARAPVGRLPQREKIDVSRETLARYAGRYRFPTGLQGFPPTLAPTMVVTVAEDGLLVEIVEGDLGQVAFFAQSENYFFSRQGWVMEFVEDDSGAITGLHWDGALWAPRL